MTPPESQARIDPVLFNQFCCRALGGEHPVHPPEQNSFRLLAAGACSSNYGLNGALASRDRILFLTLQLMNNNSSQSSWRLRASPGNCLLLGEQPA